MPGVRGDRKRPSSGWGSLTPMEQDVVRLVREGLGNKDIGARLFISPRTVQTHLTHVYAKLGIASRVQLVQLSLGAVIDVTEVAQTWPVTSPRRQILA